MKKFLSAEKKILIALLTSSSGALVAVGFALVNNQRQSASDTI